MPAHSLSRRVVLGSLGATAVAGLSGCSVGGTIDSLRAPTPATPTPARLQDQALIDGVVGAMMTADARAPRVFRKLHHAQERALGPGPEVDATAGHDWQRLQRRLPDRLTDAAVAASDPDLVRLFAAAAAGQRQLLRARGLG